jgi:hypothetical protein
MTDHQTKPFLMGSETEYAIAGRNGDGTLEPDEVYDLLLAVLRREQRWLPDSGGYRGMYLQHGGRLYLDYGAHPEHATPECQTPHQVAAYDKAGEYLLATARDRVLRERPGTHITVVKNNLDPLYPDSLTYGTHESYTCWVPADVAAPQLIPHLVSRVIYAGSGGLSSHPQGYGFELSQRARHLMHVVGSETTRERAIFSTRVRKTSDYSADGWSRAHLIGKDSQRSPLGIYLTFATTGLLFQMVNRRQRVGRGLDLADPIAALRAISRDPWLRVKVPLLDGRQYTALEIQECYLAECERAVQEGTMPEWAPEAVRHWRETLADLARDPLRLATRLDPYCKLFIYEHELLRADYTWGDLQQILEQLGRLRRQYPDQVVQALIVEDPRRLTGEALEQYGEARKDPAVTPPGALERLRFGVRLQALDVHYHELGGLYDKLVQARRMQGVVLSPADVERASRQAPPGRASVRSAGILEFQGEAGWTCDWQYLWHEASHRCVDMRNPFSGERKLVTLPLPEDDEDRPGVLELLEHLDAPAAAPVV